MSVALPSFVTSGGIPPLPPLDADLTRRLLEAAAKVELHDDELNAVRAVCDRVDDASDFLWELIERWDFKGAGEKMMARLFGWLAGERDVMRLGDMLRRQKPWTDHVWARVAPRRRALDLLAAVDGSLASLELLRVRERIRVDDLYRAARDRLYERTRQHGRQFGDEHELCDPDLHFRDGTRTMTLGPWEFEVVARDRDDIHLRDDSGRTYRGVPRRRRDDDPELVENARETWELLRSTLVEVLSRAPQRLELAMLTGRRWKHEPWRRAWLEHGLLASTCRGVVWRGLTDDGPVTFFIEEQVPTTHDGSEISLDSIWAFEVAHPTTLEHDWATLFAEHQIVQPFAQLARPTSRAAERLNPDVLIAAARWGWASHLRRTAGPRDLLVLRTRSYHVRVRIEPGLATTAADRLKNRQPPQRVVQTEVRDSQTNELLHEDEWPELVNVELGVLYARAAL